MLKRVQHDKTKSVIPNLFRNLKVANVNKSMAFVLIQYKIQDARFKIYDT
jgi:hypothetical protein